MADDTHRSRHAISDARALRGYELQMLATAAAYDLRQRVERARSTADLEALFFGLVGALRPSLFIEAGAKDAGASRRARACCPDARIVAFEANPRTHRRFRSVNADPALQVEYLNIALTDRPGKVMFNVRRTEDGRLRADGQGSLLQRPDYAPGYQPVEVEATTLDAFFARIDEGICALWIDVEGASQQVLGGAHATLAKAAVLFVEVEDYPYWQQQWLMPDVARCLYEAGLVPVARDYQTELQYNVVFLRESLIDDWRFRAPFQAYRSAIARPTRTDEPRPAAPAPTPSATVLPAALERWRRKARKLAADPRQFCADSSLSVVRRAGALLWRA